LYPLIRVDKRIPDGSIWQTRWGYLLAPIDGWIRIYQPAGTRWSNPAGGWTAKEDGMSLFHPDRPFTIACHGPRDQKRFYIDIAHRVRIKADVLEFRDLLLDVMSDPSGAVSEKDEYQLMFLPPEERRFAREARDVVRALIAAADPLFDARGRYYALPPGAETLPPSTQTTEAR
jgi:predicted RNA-binding protein associated with RNAse of E/G family